MASMAEVCNYCLIEMCFQCNQPDSTNDAENLDCCCHGTYGRVTLGSLFSPPIEKKSKATVTDDGVKLNWRGNPVGGPLGRPPLDPADMKSPLTAGRARAEDLAPIPEGYICEWSMLRYAGGGPVPIIGCAGNTATDRHHGPDKSTLNNTMGINLHRICAECHNRWHTLNDEYYPDRPDDNSTYLPLEGFVAKPHDRNVRAEPEDVKRSNEWWGLGKSKRGSYSTLRFELSRSNVT
jgi:hypothetical protein